MALINCPECSQEVSDKANSCPNCGYPFATTSTINSNDSVLVNTYQKTNLGIIANLFSNRQPHEKLIQVAIFLSILSYILPWTRFNSIEHPDFMSFNLYIDRIDALLLILFYTYPAINLLKRNEPIKNYSILSSVCLSIYYVRVIVNKSNSLGELSHLGTFSPGIGAWLVLIGAVIYCIGSFRAPNTNISASNNKLTFGTIFNVALSIAAISLLMWIISGNMFMIIFSVVTTITVFSYPIFVNKYSTNFNKTYALLSSLIFSSVLLMILTRSLNDAYRIVCVISLLTACIIYCIGSIKYGES